MTNLRTFISDLISEHFNNPSYITVYHGANNKYADDIKRSGLIDKTGYNQGWYMVSTDFESALYHATPINKEDVSVFEFRVPIEHDGKVYWTGYPYLWKGEKRNDKSTWFALMRKLPPSFIHKIHVIPYNIWLKQKEDKF